MPRKNNRPSLNEYFGLDAEAYGTSRWMARNQVQTTQKVLNLLESNEIDGKFLLISSNSLFLDIGCGTGYSSHTILDTKKMSRAVGIDLSRDMLKICQRNKDLHLILADMRYLPFRSKIFNFIISISAFNFASEGAKSQGQMKLFIEKALNALKWVIKNQGRIGIEFYPTKIEENFFLKGLKRLQFQGGLLIEQPNSKKEKKFLILKEDSKNCKS